MARTNRIASVPTVNGTAPTRKPRTQRTPEQIEAARIKAQEKADAARAEFTAAVDARLAEIAQSVNAAGMAQSGRVRRVVSMTLGGVATLVLALSLVHSSKAIADLTHQNLFMGVLLAVGIDVGLVVCKLAYMFSKSKVNKRWSIGTVVLTVIVSIMLNTHTCWAEIQTMRVVFEWALGIIVPVLVLLFSIIASHLWEE